MKGATEYDTIFDPSSILETRIREMEEKIEWILMKLKRHNAETKTLHQTLSEIREKAK
jgi:hypothetical protein